MTRYFLNSVSIEGFRGINNDGDPLLLRFKTDGVNSIHAPNGHGKTSVFEALHFAIRGTVPRLERMQEAERGDTYIINKFHPGKQATIALVFSSDDETPNVAVTVRRDAAGSRLVSSPSGHGDPEGFLASLQEDFILLDYRRFADFIDASALERGRSFASLVGLSRYSSLRQAIESAKNTRNINSDLGLSKLEGEVKAGEDALAGMLRNVISTHNEVTGLELTAVESLDRLKASVTEALKGIALLNKFIGTSSVMDMDVDAAEKIIEREEGGDARKTLTDLVEATKVLLALEISDAEIKDIERLLGLARQRDEAVQRVGMAELRSLLQGALTVVTRAEWLDPDLCPICDTRGESLKEKLEAKLALYNQAERLDQELARETASAPSLMRLRQIEEAAAMAVAPEDRLFGQLSRSASANAVPTTELERVKRRLLSLEQHREDSVKAARSELEKLQATLPPSLVQVTKTLSAARQFRSAVSSYEKTIPGLQQKQTKLARLIRWKAFITACADTFAKAETDLANERIKEIQAGCQELFAQLVSGGQDVKPTLERAQASEQVDLRLDDFFGLKDLSARALLSESYRNAIAAAIFLVSATKHSGVPRFVVLDDVTSSFDAGHQFYLMEAIRTKLRYGVARDGLQFIILSHDTSLEKYFDKLNGGSDWHHQKLQGLPPIGRLMASAQEADRLKTQAETYLNAGQIDIGAPFVRQYLEYKLGQIITRLEVPVPPDYATRGDKRTLSTYLGAIGDAVELYTAANRCVLTTKQVNDLQTQYLPSIIGNFVSHYETGAGCPFNSYALLGVIKSIDYLADCFTYTDPGTAQKRFYRRLDKQ